MEQEAKATFLFIEKCVYTFAFENYKNIVFFSRKGSRKKNKLCIYKN